MNVLIACEESQRVCQAFREKGHNAFSCDILKCSGNHPEWHIRTNVEKIINGGWFFTMDETEHTIDKWDLVIAHPPCTYLTVTGNRWFNIEKYGTKAIERIHCRQMAVNFFKLFTNINCEKVAIENPIGVMSTYYRKPDQIIQPFQFGHPTRKKTCLWLKNLPCLVPTQIVIPEIIKYKNGKGTDDFWHMSTINLPAEERTRIRSQTFPGIAKAMADQWG